MNSLHLLTVALRAANSLKALAVSLALSPVMSLADNQRADIDALIDGLHQNAHEGNFQTYVDR